eukprot:TCONS_00019639-protein
MKSHLIFLAILLPTLVISDDISLLKSQIQQLQTELAKEKAEIKVLQSKDKARNGICGIKSNPCGSCLCVEDYNTHQKYFCDCRAKPARKDCREHYDQGERTNGLYQIILFELNIIQVFCDHETSPGGWTVIQRRMDGSENFYRSWEEYKNGFGQLHREHWLGNEHISTLTAQAAITGSELRIDMKFAKRQTEYSMLYGNFDVGRESTGYQLYVVDRKSSFGMELHNGMKFSTYDKDQDPNPDFNCAVTLRAGWWFHDCESDANLNQSCNLNGQYDMLEIYYDLRNVFSWKANYRLGVSEMKVRRK